DGRLDDEIGCAEIGLADTEVDDVAALRGERVGTGEHCEGVLLADAIEGRDGAKHGVLPVKLAAICPGGGRGVNRRDPYHCGRSTARPYASPRRSRRPTIRSAATR